MLRRIAIAALVLSVAAGLTWAAETQKGTVKSVTGNSVVITDTAGKEWSFVVDKGTVVFVKGAHKKLDAVKADGKMPTINEFVSEKQEVSVKYEKSTKQEGYLVAKEVHVVK